MPLLKVRCSKCNAIISTGTEMSYETFRNATFIKRSVQCPQCGNTQSWTTDDVDRSVFKETASK
jgi:RNase P subunit RPR2